mgnify:CR=1 FL=1
MNPQQGEQQGDTERATEVVGSADTMPDAFSESAQAALPSTLNAPPASRWPGRLVRLALAAGLGALAVAAQVLELHAVHHAHQKGIIHRDLKPGNILAGTDGGREPRPKIIDFGVAKATSQQLTEQTLFTQLGQMVGTPLYMSPEQAGISSEDIDTRSDVYSLGVCCFLALTGTDPFDFDGGEDNEDGSFCTGRRACASLPRSLRDAACLGRAFSMAADWTDALKRARDHAPFLARGLERHEEIARLLTDGAADDALHLAKTAGAGIDDIGVALRREKRALGLVLAIGDLAGAFELDKVMRELSLFADRSLHRAIEAAILRRVPDAQPQGLIGLALGKHGAGELNYSSDIDPILLYDPETLPRRERDEPGEAAQRYAREVVRLLSDVTAEGYVFRVDLRLRPASEVSPLAIPLDAAITHYESSALAWERAAFIRARACAGV